MPQIKTIKIKHADGFAVINASDFDEATMEMFDDTKPKAKAKRAPKNRKATSEVNSGD